MERMEVSEPLRDKVTRMEEKVESLQKDMNGVKVDIKSILARLDTASGGWKVLMTLLSLAGAIGAFVTAVLHNALGH